MPARVLALEPFYGGSHRAFLDGWISHSRHDWTVMSLPARKWKWRMRHAPITFARRTLDRIASGQSWDVLFCSDMLNLAEFLGLAPRQVRELPVVAYFHENQLTYPVREERRRDLHFAFTNITTAEAATQVWFNSAFHRDEFIDATAGLLKRMPDHAPLELVGRLRDKSFVCYPGVSPMPPRGPRRPGPMRVLWAARWEHDKNPEAFFEAMTILASRGVGFRLSVIGEQFDDRPAVFDAARRQFGDRIDRWGRQPSGEAYTEALLDADVVVSTAIHEFFGIGVVEAVAAGAFPLLPHRLAYPEVLGLAPHDSQQAVVGCDETVRERCFYDGSPTELAGRLEALSACVDRGEALPLSDVELRALVARFGWRSAATDLDDAIDAVLVR